MKKTALFIVGLLAAGIAAQAQNVYESVAPFGKERKPAFSMTIDYPKSLVDEAVSDRFKKDKLKGKSSSGMTLYAQANYPNICAQQCDIYTKVDGTSKSATIYIFVSKGYDNFVTSGEDEDSAGRIKTFMLSLMPDIRALELSYQIEEQTKIAEKAQNEYEKLTNQKTKLEKEMNNLDIDIQKADENRQQQKAILENLQAKKSK